MLFGSATMIGMNKIWFERQVENLIDFVRLGPRICILVRYCGVSAHTRVLFFKRCFASIVIPIPKTRILLLIRRGISTLCKCFLNRNIYIFIYIYIYIDIVIANSIAIVTITDWGHNSSKKSCRVGCHHREELGGITDQRAGMTNRLGNICNFD